MNRVDLVGYLTRDPDLRHTTSGTPVCQINLAVRRPFSSQNNSDNADFITVVAWDKQAENIGKYLTKGRLVSVEGRIQTRNYVDKDGKKVYVTEVVANNVQFLSTNGGNSNNISGITNEINPFDVGISQEPSTPVQSVSVDKDPFESFGETITITDNEIDNELPF